MSTLRFIPAAAALALTLLRATTAVA